MEGNEPVRLDAKWRGGHSANVQRQLGVTWNNKLAPFRPDSKMGMISVSRRPKLILEQHLCYHHTHDIKWHNYTRRLETQRRSWAGMPRDMQDIYHGWLRNQWYGGYVSFVGRILALQGRTVYLERNLPTHRKVTDRYRMLGSKWEMWRSSSQKVCPLGQLKLPWATPMGRWSEEVKEKR